MLVRFIFVSCICFSSYSYADKTSLSLAVLSYNPDVNTIVLYQSILNEMSGQLRDYDFELTVLDTDTLVKEGNYQSFDFFLLDPVSFLILRSRGAIGEALGTLSRGHGSLTTNLMGGVIVMKKGVPTIPLQEIYQHDISISSPNYLENYIAQVFELEAFGYSKPTPDKLTIYESPEQVIESIVYGQQKIGFVRTGVIETLIKQNQLQADALQILNVQHLAGYPFGVSTRLYPEWVFVANSKTSSEVTRSVASALLALRVGGESSYQYDVNGFTPPLNYMAVEEVLKSLSMEPHQEISQRWWKTLSQYIWYVGLVFAVVSALVYLSLNTYRQNRHLTVLVRQEKKAQARLSKSHKQLDELLSSSPAVIYSLDPEHYRLTFISSNCFKLYHKTAEEVKNTPNWWKTSIHPDDLEKTLKLFQQWSRSDYRETLVFSYRLACDDQWVWIEDRLQAIRNEEDEVTLLVGAHSDITGRHLSEEQLELWASVFANAREGIAITDPNGSILDVNAAFSRITGYSRAEILGQNPRILNSGRQSKEFYQQMWEQILSAGFWEGEIWNRRKDGNIYAQNLTVVSVNDSEGEVSHYISLFSDITRQKRNEEQLEHIAYFDALTGLPNRTNLTSTLDIKIQNASLYGTHFALSFLDLDGFKEVNDTFGHETGDLLLVSVAQRMKATLSEDSVVARFGGDEFVLILSILDERIEVDARLQSLLTALAEPFKISGVTLHISASIGVTYYPQRRVIEADQLIRQADQAMYQAKISGRNRLKAFDLSQEDILVEQHRFYDELQTAFETDQFCLYYQPKVNMRTREVIGYEALIRWLHPEQGVLLPATFLPAMTNQALELKVGFWVIQTALEQMQAWNELEVCPCVSVNVAGYQLQQASFIPELCALLGQFPNEIVKRLELEILETSAIEDLAKVSEVIEVCKMLGISVSLDDFGTGYSTLSHLKELPVDVLKIDHGFIRDMLIDKSDLAIIKGVIGFAEAFSLGVIAEGVETFEHMEQLIHLGCEYGQGYYISRPMPAEQVPQWYDQWVEAKTEIV